MARLSEHYPPQQEDPDRQDAPAAAWSSAHDGVASLLAKRRDALGWKLTDIADALKIRAEYLAALERGSLEGLPGPAYAMGFLRAYADYLGFDGKDIVRRFKAEQTSLNAKPELTFPMPLTERGVPGSGLLLTALIIVGLGYGTWYYLTSGKGEPPPEVQAVPAELAAKPAPPPQTKPALAAMAPAQSPAGPQPSAVPAQPSGTLVQAMPSTPSAPLTPPAAAGFGVPTAAIPASAVPKAAAPPIATAGLAPATPIVPPNTEPLGPAPSATQTAPASPPVQVAAASRVVIAATAKTWFQLSENHKPIVTKMLAAGDSYSVPDRPGISLWTGNAGGIHLIVDGQSLPSLGRVGEIKRHIDLDPAALLATPVH